MMKQVDCSRFIIVQAVLLCLQIGLLFLLVRKLDSYRIVPNEGMQRVLVEHVLPGMQRSSDEHASHGILQIVLGEDHPRLRLVFGDRMFLLEEPESSLDADTILNLVSGEGDVLFNFAFSEKAPFQLVMGDRRLKFGKLVRDTQSETIMKELNEKASQQIVEWLKQPMPQEGCEVCKSPEYQRLLAEIDNEMSIPPVKRRRSPAS